MTVEYGSARSAEPKHRPVVLLHHARHAGFYSSDRTDPRQLSVKSLRYTGDRWSRQSEALPLHRCLDATTLIATTVMEFNGATEVTLERGVLERQDQCMQIPIETKGDPRMGRVPAQFDRSARPGAPRQVGRCSDRPSRGVLAVSRLWRGNHGPLCAGGRPFPAYRKMDVSSRSSRPTNAVRSGALNLRDLRAFRTSTLKNRAPPSARRSWRKAPRPLAASALPPCRYRNRTPSPGVPEGASSRHQRDSDSGGLRSAAPDRPPSLAPLNASEPILASSACLISRLVSFVIFRSICYDGAAVLPNSQPVPNSASVTSVTFGLQREVPGTNSNNPVAPT